MTRCCCWPRCCVTAAELREFFKPPKRYSKFGSSASSLVKRAETDHSASFQASEGQSFQEITPDCVTVQPRKIQIKTAPLKDSYTQTVKEQSSNSSAVLPVKTDSKGVQVAAPVPEIAKVKTFDTSTQTVKEQSSNSSAVLPVKTDSKGIQVAAPVPEIAKVKTFDTSTRIFSGVRSNTPDLTGCDVRSLSDFDAFLKKYNDTLDISEPSLCDSTVRIVQGRKFLSTAARLFVGSEDSAENWDGIKVSALELFSDIVLLSSLGLNSERVKFSSDDHPNSD
ncbi:UNVERIFIED_CONTAM: hypothetical protein PYX00_001547 [Menopon gallinae]|uniref:Uncharacterized protein n=1 Tax=Menopon gallinae TaxID=328185 RepID=A0AAW2ID26_9NEOP